MKIALLSYEYPPDTGFGGIGSYTWHHARGLAALGHEVHVLAGARQPQALVSRQDAHGVHVHRYWADDLVMRGATALNRLQWWWSRQRLQNAWSMARGLRQLMRQHRFDVLELPECGAEGALVTARRSVPTVVRLHSPAQLIMPFYDVRAGDIRCCAALERQALQRAQAVTACSDFVAQATAQAIGLRAPAQVITNGLDLDWFDATEDDQDILRTLDLPPDRPVLLFTGRLERRKGIGLVGRIAQRVLAEHEVSLVLAGDDLFGHYQREVLPALQGRSLRGSVHCLGHQPIGHIRALVRRCSVFLLPSLWENCPYAGLEAMAAGRPVVAARQGGLPEMLSHGHTGLLAEPGNPDDFARCIGQLLGDAALRARLGAAARQAVALRHRHTTVAAQALAVYDQAAA